MFVAMKLNGREVLEKKVYKYRKPALDFCKKHDWDRIEEVNANNYCICTVYDKFMERMAVETRKNEPMRTVNCWIEGVPGLDGFYRPYEDDLEVTFEQCVQCVQQLSQQHPGLLITYDIWNRGIIEQKGKIITNLD